MLIAPDSKLYILKDVPLDTTYEHTLWFDIVPNKEYGQRIQALSFSDKAKYKLEFGSEYGGAFTYVRVNRNRIKVPFKADDLYDCNYIMFQNTGFGNKWFYAFIKSVEYVNNRTSEITFEIDVMQTWHFDYVIDDCFVEREHSETDVVGANTLPEDVAIGDYICDEMQVLTDSNNTPIIGDWVIVMARTSEVDALPIPAAGGWYGNQVYQQVEYKTYPNNETGADALRTDLRNMSIFNNTDSVARIFMFPRALVPEVTNVTPITGMKIFERPVSFGTYTPKNNKLFTFPYSCLTITDLQGKTIDYHWEYFNEPSEAKFEWLVSFGVKPSIILYPVGYLQNIYTDSGRVAFPTMEYRITLDTFPDVPYATTDLYAKIVQGGMGLAIGALTGNAVSTTNSVVKTTQNLTEQGYKTRYTSTVRKTSETTQTPSISKEIANTISTVVQNGRADSSIGDQQGLANIGWCTFVIMKNHIREEYARVIDDYFSTYGYATKRIKHPNRSERPHWNYVKTIGCTITGSVPCDDMATICSIYDRGITFWKNMAEIGDYSFDNSPIL